MNILEQPCSISPSLICFDLCNLESEVRRLEQLGVQMLHVDLLDGYFSPSMPLGLDTVRRLRALTKLPFEVHLMAERQEFFVDELLDIGVQQLVFHVECERHADQMLNRIKGSGVRAGVALKPATPVGTLDYVLEKCDAVLLMLINPGYASSPYEAQVPYAARKIMDLKQMIDRQGLSTRIELDGRISLENIREFGRLGANIFVCGTTCIKKDDLSGSFQALHALAAEMNRSKGV